MAQERFFGECSMPDVAEQWRDYFRLLDLGPGQRVLDVGCHQGDAIALLLSQHPELSRVIGVDRNEQKAGYAQRRFQGDDRVEIVRADAVSLPFAESSFDWVFTADTLEWVSDPSTALHEIRRTLVDGGSALVIHTDFDTQVFASGDIGLTRRIVHDFTDGGRRGTIGRELYGLCTAAGFSRVEPSVRTFIGTSFAAGLYARKMVDMMRKWLVDEGRIDAADFDGWSGALEQRDRDRSFFYSVNRNICLCSK
ncbi:MAG: methyltransferase domain-containing protein [Deltaproteobacteria bacterium]|nr:methyltransferase domain-containing protein [Nannocystaceae bacterium]